MSCSRAPLVPPALAFAAGIALAPVLAPETAWPVLIGALAWAASLVILERPAPATAFLLTGIVAAGALRAAPLPPAPDDVGHLLLPLEARVEGRLSAEPRRFATDRTRLLLDVERVGTEARTGRVPLAIHGLGLPEFTEGQRLAVRA